MGIGIMQVNSLEVGMPPHHGELMGFYPTFANINHSCLPSARPTKHEDKSVSVVSLVSLSKGQEITIPYMYEAQPTFQRRNILSKKWFFLCNCVRCLDMSEAGTFLGALLCQECGGHSLQGVGQEAKEFRGFTCQQCGAK